MGVQAYCSQPGIDCLDEGFVGPLAGADEMPVDAVLMASAEHDVGGERSKMIRHPLNTQLDTRAIYSFASL